ncbi:MAG: hypothetical protein L0221_05805 [Chloroflexi bacterium]|nr:hypothetical protein [Chloroflexota bacterium]
MPSDPNPSPTRVSAAACRRTLAIAAGVAALAAGALFAVHAVQAGTVGPDVTVHELTGPGNYAAAGGFEAYSLGTVSCNQGDVVLNWCNNIGGCSTGATQEEHPVIAQNLYRLKDGRFEQIGMSWLKHGFTALAGSDPACGDGSCSPPGTGDLLGVGCTDPYSSSLNGNTPLGMRSEVNATTGIFPYPYTQVATGDSTDQRIKVAIEDVDPAQNPGAVYFTEGQYVAADDAAAENGRNNASYRQAFVSAGTFALSFSGVAPIVRQLPAIAAWQAMDPGVELISVDIPGSVPLQRFHVGRKVTDLGGGDFHYEYAVHNLNSDRSAYSFMVDFPGAAAITNAGFHDIDHHSGEPYATTDWTIDTAMPGQVTWATDDFATDPDANALRWATMFSFWFDADADPSGASHTLGLFKPGSPAAVTFSFTTTLFADGFESGDTAAWSQSTP